MRYFPRDCESFSSSESDDGLLRDYDSSASSSEYDDLPLSEFDNLVNKLSDVLGHSSGLTSSDVDPNEIMRIMEKYTSDSREWGRYALADTSRAYTRNLVDEGNGKSNLLILVWNPGKGSAIHDHADAHCIMKILNGSLKETLYAWPEEQQPKNGQRPPLKIKKETIYPENHVAYMSDDLGIHRMSNPDPEKPAISLHLYTPPHAAHYGFSIFDEKSGSSHHISQSEFYSRHGRRCSSAFL